MPPIFEVLSYAYDPKEGLLRMDEFMQALCDEDDQQEESRQTMNPKVAKKNQEGLRRNLIKKTFSSGNSKLPKL